MGKKDLKFLKSTLGEIRTTNIKIGKLSGQKKEAQKMLRRTKKELEASTAPVELVGDYDFLKSMKKADLQDILENAGMRVGGNKPALIHRILAADLVPGESSDRIDELKIMLRNVYKSARIGEKKAALKDHENSNPNNTTAWSLVFLITVIALLAGGAADSRNLAEYHDAGFDCDNGERIHGSLVLNGESDCSNGHDEKDPLWSISDARNYDYDEPWGLVLFGPVVVLAIGFFLVEMTNSSKPDKHNRKKRELKNHVRQAEAEVGTIKRRYDGAVRSLHAEERSSMEKERLSEEREKYESRIESLKPQLSQLNTKRSELFEEIAHLIPYSNLLD